MKSWSLVAVLMLTGCTLQVNNPNVGSGNTAIVKGTATANVRANGAVAVGPNATAAASSGGSDTAITPQGQATPGDTPVTVGSSKPPIGAVSTATPAPPTGTPDPKYHAPLFTALQTFSSAAVYEIIDYNNVVVADGTTVTITRDAGLTWSTYSAPSAIANMSWIDAAHGWCVTKQHALLKLTVGETGVSSEVAPTGAAAGMAPMAVCFTSETDGALALGANSVYTTHDGGLTWKPTATVGEINSNSTFVRGPGGRMAFVDHASASRVFAYANGGFAEVQVSAFYNGTIAQATTVAFGGSTAIIGGTGKRPLASTTDWSNLVPINTTVVTSSQTLTNGVTGVYPIDDSTWIGTNPFWMTLTRDAGQHWLEPSQEKQGSFDWIKPFDESKMWALRNSALCRAGSP